MFIANKYVKIFRILLKLLLPLTSIWKEMVA